MKSNTTPFQYRSYGDSSREVRIVSEVRLVDEKDYSKEATARMHAYSTAPLIIQKKQPHVSI